MSNVRSGMVVTHAGSASGLAVLLVWVAGRVGVRLSAEDGAIAAGACASLGAAVGKYGIRGLAARVWRGAS